MHKGLDSVMRCAGVTYPVVDGCFPLSLHESDHTDFLPRSPWRRSVPALGRTNVEPPVSCPLAAAGLRLTVVIIFRHHLASSRQPPAVLGPSSGPGASQSEVVSLYLSKMHKIIENRPKKRGEKTYKAALAVCPLELFKLLMQVK